MEIIKPQRNQTIFGTRAFDEKRTPPCRTQEHSDFSGRQPSSGKRGEVVSCNRSLLHKSHIICVGATRSGKTAGIGQVLTKQMLEAYDEQWTTPNGTQHSEERRLFVGFTDMKAAKGLANSLEQMAKNAGVPFYHISEDPDNSWRFNPMSLFMGLKKQAARNASSFISSMQLDYGPGFGPQFYTNQATSLAVELGEHLYRVWEHGGNPTIQEGIRFIHKNGKSNPRDSESLLSTLTLLKPYAHLQPRIDEEHVFDFYGHQKQPGLLAASFDGLNNGPIARLFSALLNANVLAGRKRIVDEHIGDCSPVPRTYWLFDEAQHLVSRNMASYLTGAAGFGLTYCLLVQSMSSFKTRDLDLRHDVWTNCQIKCIHSCSEEDDFRALQALSRETIRPLGSRTVASDFRFFGRRAIEAESESDRLEPLTTRREIQELSSTPHRCYVILGGEFSEPIPTDTFFAESFAEHLENEAKPWPKAPSSLKYDHDCKESRGTNSSSNQPPWLEAHLSPNKSPKHAKRIERFRKLLGKLRDEEKPSRKE